MIGLHLIDTAVAGPHAHARLRPPRPSCEVDAFPRHQGDAHSFFEGDKARVRNVTWVVGVFERVLPVAGGEQHDGFGVYGRVEVDDAVGIGAHSPDLDVHNVV